MRAVWRVSSVLAGLTTLVVTIGVLIGTIGLEQSHPLAASSREGFQPGSSIIYPVSLHPGDHIGPVVIDPARQGIWFASAVDMVDAINFYSTRSRTLTSYPVPASQRSAFIREGIALASDGSVWAAFGSVLSRWDPTTRRATQVRLPIPPLGSRIPTPVDDLLGAMPPLTGVVGDSRGGVWVGQESVRGIIHVNASGSNASYLILPADAADVWSGVLEPNGTILWTTGFAAAAPGRLETMVIRLDPVSEIVTLLQEPTQSLVPDGSGGFYRTVGEQVSHTDGSSVHTQGPRALTDALAFDAMRSKLWFQDQTQPSFHSLDTRTGAVRTYEYPASTYTTKIHGSPERTVLVRPHIRNMAVDGAGNLWFSIRGGFQIGEVLASQ